ncbi:MAG: helix-turn-helix transcriptional regulator [Actinomycetota bacterium]
MDLKQLRETRGMNQASAAAVVGISQAMWSGLETGTTNPSPETVQKIAAAFDVEHSYAKRVLKSSADKASMDAKELAAAILALSPAELIDMAQKAPDARSQRLLLAVAAQKSEGVGDPWADPDRDALGRRKSASKGAVQRDAVGRSRKDRKGNVMREATK